MFISDLDEAPVEYIGDDRRQESLDSYVTCMPSKKRTKIHANSTDIWDLYLALIWAHISQAEEKIVFDRYYLMTHIVKAVEEVQLR